jgi:hypothetical protein
LTLPNGVLKIKPNLAAVLRQLRLADALRTLWIDAICINQDDENEKGQQVALMGDIYRTAISVQIWLGAGSEATSTTADFLKPLAENSESYGIKRWIHQGHF